MTAIDYTTPLSVFYNHLSLIMRAYNKDGEWMLTFNTKQSIDSADNISYTICHYTKTLVITLPATGD